MVNESEFVFEMDKIVPKLKNIIHKISENNNKMNNKIESLIQGVYSSKRNFL